MTTLTIRQRGSADPDISAVNAIVGRPALRPTLAVTVEVLLTFLASCEVTTTTTDRWAPTSPKFGQPPRCAETDPELFFPERGKSAASPRSICDRCENRVECLLWALVHQPQFGIWGGATPSERRRIVAAWRQANTS